MASFIIWFKIDMISILFLYSLNSKHLSFLKNRIFEGSDMVWWGHSTREESFQWGIRRKVRFLDKIFNHISTCSQIRNWSKPLKKIFRRACDYARQRKNVKFWPFFFFLVYTLVMGGEATPAPCYCYKSYQLFEGWLPQEKRCNPKRLEWSKTI